MGSVRTLLPSQEKFMLLLPLLVIKCIDRLSLRYNRYLLILHYVWCCYGREINNNWTTGIEILENYSEIGLRCMHIEKLLWFQHLKKWTVQGVEMLVKAFFNHCSLHKLHSLLLCLLSVAFSHLFLPKWYKCQSATCVFMTISAGDDTFHIWPVLTHISWAVIIIEPCLDHDNSMQDMYLNQSRRTILFFFKVSLYNSATS